MKIPESIQKCVQDAVVEHPDNLQQAIQCALEKVKHSKDYKDYVESLVHGGISNLIHDEIHAINLSLRESLYDDDQKPRSVNTLDEKLIRDTEENLYLFRIAGTRLGLIKGEDLEMIAEGEQSRGKGYLFRAKVCRLLKPKVPKDKTVEESVSLEELKKVFKKAT